MVKCHCLCHRILTCNLGHLCHLGSYVTQVTEAIVSSSRLVTLHLLDSLSSGLLAPGVTVSVASFMFMFTENTSLTLIPGMISSGPSKNIWLLTLWSASDAASLMHLNLPAVSLGQTKIKCKILRPITRFLQTIARAGIHRLRLKYLPTNIDLSN